MDLLDALDFLNPLGESTALDMVLEILGISLSLLKIAQLGV